MTQEDQPCLGIATLQVTHDHRHVFPVCQEALGRSFFLPAIVTTAPLYTLRYEPTEIRLETGSFDNLDPKKIEQIPWVRFHKTLTAQPGSIARTVVVVNSAALPTFLDEISRAQSFRP